MSKPYIVTLSDTTESYFKLKKDEVETGEDEENNENNKKSSEDEIQVVVTEEGIKDRIESLPVSSGNYFGFVPVEGGVYYTASSRQSGSSFKYFDLVDKKETDLGAIHGYVVSHDRKKILYRKGSHYYLQNLNPKNIAADNQIDLEGMKVYIDQKAEWEQILNETRSEERRVGKEYRSRTWRERQAERRT